MAYIGRQQDGFGVRSRFIYTATGGQTTFTTDDSSNALSYSDGAYVDVYLNGVLLDPSDYTATSLTSIVLDSGASADDVLEVIVYDIFSVFSGTFTNGITASEATITNGISAGSATVTGDLTVDTDTLYVDSTNNRVGVGTVSPAVPLHVKVGTNENFFMSSDSGVRIQAINDAASAINTMKIGGDPLIFLGTGGTERMRIDSSGNVGVGTTSPDGKIHAFSGDASQTANTSANQLVAENSGNAGLSILSGSTSLGNVYFADSGSNTAGFIQYKHGDNYLRFGTDSSERMRIDSSGNVTMSNQPMFHARRTSTSTIATGNFIVYNGAYVNRGSHYNTSNGRFTAPVAGVYAFFWDSIANNTNGLYRLYMYKNGSIAGSGDMHLRLNTSDNLYGVNSSRIVLLDLAANDYVQIYYSTGPTGLYSGSDYLTFGGYLLG